ncbi:hypothetical protein ACVIGB_000912 [Bradyrhizobium sp. USDA 4341]
MAFSRCTVPTRYGEALVEQTGAEDFRVSIESADVDGVRFMAIAHLFMSEPGEFIEFTPDGHDRFLMLPHGLTAQMPDASQFASDLDLGLVTLVPADDLHTAEDKLRAAVREAACKSFDRIYGRAEDLAPDVGYEPSPAM